MEGGVEARDLRHAGRNASNRINPFETCPLVQRSQVDEIPQVGQHAFVDDHRRGVARPSVHDAVTDGVESTEIGDRVAEGATAE